MADTSIQPGKRAVDRKEIDLKQILRNAVGESAYYIPSRMALIAMDKACRKVIRIIAEEVPMPDKSRAAVLKVGERIK